MPAKVDRMWEIEVASIVKEDPQISARNIHQMLVSRAALFPHLQEVSGGVPNWRTCHRIREDLKIPERSAGIQNPEAFEDYHFPNSHEKAESPVPWEASSVAIELMEYQRQHDPENPRPNVAEIRWAHRIRQADPDVPVEELYKLVWWMVAIGTREVKTEPQISARTVLEAYLEHKPYRRPSGVAAFETDSRTRARLVDDRVPQQMNVVSDPSGRVATNLSLETIIQLQPQRVLGQKSSSGRVTLGRQQQKIRVRPGKGRINIRIDQGGKNE